jgi:hypothetical protein
VIPLACGRGGLPSRGGEGGHVRHIGCGAFASSPAHRLDHYRLLHRVRPAEAGRGAPCDRPGGGVQLDAVSVVFARAKPERAVRVSRQILSLSAAVQLDAPGAAQPRIGDNNLALRTDQLQLVAAGEIQPNVELANDIVRQRERCGQAQVATLRTGGRVGHLDRPHLERLAAEQRIALMQ